ncbi:MAG: flagellar biosynthesis protein FlhA [Planctomycetes bacterium]|nr:flagellar biosynthesis protein FlhA [Planctomycetota bacterium]
MIPPKPALRMEWLVPAAFIGLVAVLVVPLPPMAMDALIAVNFALSGLVLATAANMKKPLDFSVFPALVLGTTLLRLGINVASTRLILGMDAATPEAGRAVAGSVIEAFGEIAAGRNPIVGLSVFAMLVVVQFVVVTRGSVRMGEVSARFALDALPGRQMAIDADVASGAITPTEASQRRDVVLREADFHGAMDGAGRFVRGDAVAGIVIVLVNILGGFLVGMIQKNWSISESLRVFTLLAVGDGLVTQIPAFLVATASGLVAAKAASGETLGTEIPRQLGARPVTLWIVAGLLAGLSVTPLPTAPLLGASMLLAAAAWWIGRVQVAAGRLAVQTERAALSASESLEDALLIEPISIDLGLDLLMLAHQERSETGLLPLVAGVRRQLAMELGVVVPSVRIRDDPNLPADSYVIRLRGAAVGGGTLRPGRMLVMDPKGGAPEVAGEPAQEPAFGLPAIWVEDSVARSLEGQGFAIADSGGVLATHLLEVLRKKAWELVTLEETAKMLERLRSRSPNLAAMLAPPTWTLDRIRGILQELLREGVAIRDIEKIAELLVSLPVATQPDQTIAVVRSVVSHDVCDRLITRNSSGNRVLHAVWMDEETMLSSGALAAAQRSVVPEAAAAERLVRCVAPGLRDLLRRGLPAVVVTPLPLRGAVSKALRGRLGDVSVIAREEIPEGVELVLAEATQTEAVK